MSYASKYGEREDRRSRRKSRVVVTEVGEKG